MRSSNITENLAFGKSLRTYPLWDPDIATETMIDLVLSAVYEQREHPT